MGKVELKGVWKIFGPNPDYVLESIRDGDSREKILNDSGHVIAVRDVSLDIAEGEIFVVMGLSGSGKSTLVRCLSRLIEPTAGQVLINQEDVTAMPVNQLRELRRHTVSMVFQRFGLFPHRRVLDNICFGLEIQGAEPEPRRQKGLQVLELVGLNGWENHYPHELSGGMQQRVGLARALAVDPEIMLCDEPFSALDPLIRRDMQNELLNLQQTLHKTIIFITHDFLEAIKLGDRIAIMKDGQVVQVGTPQDIIANPVDDYVREFTRDVSRVKILTAGSIMQPFDGQAPHIEESVDVEASLESLIPLMLGSDGRVSVLDGEGIPVGWLDRSLVLKALAEG